MFCEKCGNQMPNNAKFCTSCGTPLKAAAPGTVKPSGSPPPPPPSAAPRSQPKPASPPPYANQAQPTPQPAQPTYQTVNVVNQTPPDFREKPLTVGQYIGMFLLLSIPIVNFIMLFVWAFSGTVNKNKKNFAIAGLLLIVIWILFWIFIGASLIMPLIYNTMSGMA